MLFRITEYSSEFQCDVKRGLIELFQVENLSNFSKRGVCTRVLGTLIALAIIPHGNSAQVTSISNCETCCPKVYASYWFCHI